jgi:hypothetical protein
MLGQVAVGQKLVFYQAIRSGKVAIMASRETPCSGNIGSG